MEGNILILLIFGNFILQSTILQHFSIASVMPNTALILVVIVSMLEGKKKGITAGGLAGLLQDLFFSRALGVNIMIYITIAYLIGTLENKIFKDNIFAPLLLIISSTFLYHLLNYIIMFFLISEVDFIFIIKRIFIIEVLYNVAIGIFIYNKMYSYLYSYKLR